MCLGSCKVFFSFMLKIGLIMQKIPLLPHDLISVTAVMLHYYFVNGISKQSISVDLDDQEIIFWGWAGGGL